MMLLSKVGVAEQLSIVRSVIAEHMDGQAGRELLDRLEALGDAQVVVGTPPSKKKLLRQAERNPTPSGETAFSDPL